MAYVKHSHFLLDILSILPTDLLYAFYGTNLVVVRINRWVKDGLEIGWWLGGWVVGGWVGNGWVRDGLEIGWVGGWWIGGWVESKDG